MIIKDLRTTFKNELNSLYPEEEVLSFFYLLTENLLKINRLGFATNPERIIDSKSVAEFRTATRKLKEYTPIQYIIGSTEFYGCQIKVDSHTLIPRPETEELVDWMISEISSNKTLKSVVDIGTGSGCIAIALKKNIQKLKLEAWDISSKALKLAEENARLNNVNILYNEIDILSISKTEKFDVIVSNPPYVRNLEKKDMQKNVLLHEPDSALFVEDDNPLLFYKAILNFAQYNLNADGHIYLEINEYLSDEMIQLFREFGYSHVEIRKDLFGKNRMLKAIKS